MGKAAARLTQRAQAFVDVFGLLQSVACGFTLANPLATCTIMFRVYS